MLSGTVNNERPGKGPGGRPTKYRPEYCSTIIAVGEIGRVAGRNGRACDVHRSTMDEWAAEHPEFSEALMRAKQKAQAWFERARAVRLSADKFNNAMGQTDDARHRDEYTERREVPALMVARSRRV